MSSATPRKSALDDSKIRDLERQLADESAKTCSRADSAIEESKKIIESTKSPRDSKKFKVPTVQRKK